MAEIQLQPSFTARYDDETGHVHLRFVDVASDPMSPPDNFYEVELLGEVTITPVNPPAEPEQQPA